MMASFLLNPFKTLKCAAIESIPLWRDWLCQSVNTSESDQVFFQNGNSRLFHKKQTLPNLNTFRTIKSSLLSLFFPYIYLLSGNKNPL